MALMVESICTFLVCTDLPCWVKHDKWNNWKAEKVDDMEVSLWSIFLLYLSTPEARKRETVIPASHQRSTSCHEMT